MIRYVCVFGIVLFFSCTGDDGSVVIKAKDSSKGDGEVKSLLDDVKVSSALNQSAFFFCGGVPCSEEAWTGGDLKKIQPGEIVVKMNVSGSKPLEKKVVFGEDATSTVKKVGGIQCGNGIELWRRNKVKSCHLLDRARIGGMEFTGFVELYESGKPRSGHLADSAKIDSRELPAGTRVTFDENGQLERCELGDEAVIDGIAYKREDRVCFSSNGRVRKCQ